MRTDHFAFRIIGCIVLAVLGSIALWYGIREAKDRYLVPRLGAHVARQVEKHFGWRVNYRSFSSNLVTAVHLEGVSAEPTRAVAFFTESAHPLVMMADRVHVASTPFDAIHGRIRRLEVERCRIRVGTVELALVVSQIGDLTTVGCPPQQVTIEEVAAFVRLPKALSLHGRVGVAGEGLFKAHRPHLMQVRVEGEALHMRWSPELDARVNVRLALTGLADSPALEGTILLQSGTWHGEGTHPIGAVLGAGEPALLQWADRFPGTMRVDLQGTNLDLRTDQLRAKLRAMLRLHKPLDAPARLVGVLQALEGTYTVRGREFRLVSGAIDFSDRAGAIPRLNALLETHVKRYRIRIAVSGTLGESQLHLSSRPELPRREIMALLAFGRPVVSLTQDELQELANRDEAAQFLDFLLLGRAELIAARWLGLDEINVKLSPSAAAAQPAVSPVESVEVGKYAIPDRLFGSYKLEPPRTPTDTAKHTVGAEYQLTDRLSVEGTVKAKLVEEDRTQETQLVEPQGAKRRVEAEEAFIRFRWKF